MVEPTCQMMFAGMLGYNLTTYWMRFVPIDAKSCSLQCELLSDMCLSSYVIGAARLCSRAIEIAPKSPFSLNICEQKPSNPVQYEHSISFRILILHQLGNVAVQLVPQQLATLLVKTGYCNRHKSHGYIDDSFSKETVLVLIGSVPSFCICFPFYWVIAGSCCCILFFVAYIVYLIIGN